MGERAGIMGGRGAGQNGCAKQNMSPSNSIDHD